MQTSSARYSSEILPERRHRRAVLASGVRLAALGAAVLVTMPIPIWIRSAAAALWLGYSGVSGLRLAKTYRSVAGYRIFADGSAEVVRTDGRRVVARLAAGTVLLPRFAWLRLSAPELGPLAELVAGDPRSSQQWRRFQVICRHVAAC